MTKEETLPGALVSSLYLKRFLLVLTLVLCQCQLPAQNINHYGVFPAVENIGTLSERWSYSLYYLDAFNLINNRVKNVADYPGNFLFYADQACTFKVIENLSVAGGYVFQRIKPGDKRFGNENRFYTQTIYRFRAGNAQFRNRIRYEARFVENPVTHSAPYTSRIRYQLGVLYPFNEQFYLNAYNEMYFNTFRNPVAVYSENWAYAAIGLHTENAGTWELGALYIFWVIDKARDLRNFTFLRLTWITRFDFTRK